MLYLQHQQLPTTPEKLILTVVEMQQLPEIEKTDSQKNILPKMDKIYWLEKSTCKLPD